MKLFIKISLSITILTAIGCTTSTSGNTANTAPVSGTKIAFTEVKTIVDSKCITCHSTARASGGIILDNESSILSNSSRISRAVSSGKMPPKSSSFTVSETDIKTIKDWVDQGSSSK